MDLSRFGPTCSALLGRVTDAHSLEGGDVDRGVARHQAGVVAAEDVSTLLTIGLTHEAEKIRS